MVEIMHFLMNETYLGEVSMKGLIIKDLMCLRKQRATYVYIVLLVLIVSIMYVLSARFGNIALATKDMMVENGLTDIDVKNLSSFALALFMLLPIAMVGDVTNIFSHDGKAGFANVAASLPISIEKRVLSRFITILSFFGIGVGTDLIIAFIVSLLTDILSFGEFFKIIIFAASMLFIYGALVCVYMFLLGYGKESYAQILSIMSIITFTLITNFEKAKMIFISCFVEGAAVLDVNPIEVVTGIIYKKSLIVFLMAAFVGVISYIASVYIVKRKRGII